MTSVNILWKLQEVEVKIKEENKVLESALKFKKINENIQRHKKMKKDCEMKKNIIDEQKNKLRNFEQQLKDITYQKQEIRGKLYDGKVNNAKQLEFFLKEQEKLEEITSAIETKVFEIMEDLERMEEALNQTALEEQKMHEIIRNALKDRKSRQIKCEEQIQKLSIEKKELLKHIDEKSLALYMDIKKRKNKPVSLVIGEICTGCHIDLPIMILTQVRKEKIVTCSNCGRILYYGGTKQEA
ncbi:C4-type zinc ribbon domain-containing protein [Clostridiaceae bacterium 35-E11]